MTVTLDLKVSKDRDYVSAGSRKLLALATVTASGAGSPRFAAGAGGFELVLAADCSGSMTQADGSGQRKLDEAIDGLWAIIDTLQPDDVCSIVAFDGRAATVVQQLRGTQKGSLNRPAVEEQLRTSFGGMTNIHAALAQARQCFGTDQSGFVRRVIILSDGAITEGPDESACYRLADELSAHGIVVDALGYGYSDLRWDFLSRLAGESGEREHITKSPQTVLQRIFQGAKNAVASNVRLKLHFAPSVMVGDLYRVAPSILFLQKAPLTPTQRTVEIRAGQVEPGKEYAWLIELEIGPSISRGPSNIVAAELQYRLPNGSVQQSTAALQVEFTGDEALAGQVNLMYKRLHEEAKLNKFEAVLGEAQKANDRRKIEQALSQMISFCDNVGLRGKAELYRQQLVQIRGGRDLNELAIEISKTISRSTTKMSDLAIDDSDLARPKRPVRHRR